MDHDAPHYTKVASHEAVNGEFDTCLLLYSGGLDTSVMLKWLQEKYNCKVITLTVNIGQTVDDLDAIAEKAKKLGAIETITVDARDRFADELLSLAIKANADYQGGYALCTPLGRIIISQLAVEYAEKYNCTVIAHGATGKGNDQVRFETYIDDQNQKVTGTVTVRLYKGAITVVSVDSPHSLFDINLATFDSNTAFNQNSSAGFIELYSLSQRTAEGAYSYGK